MHSLDKRGFVAKKRANRQDATLRNVTAAAKRDRVLAEQDRRALARDQDLASAVAHLDRRVTLLTLAPSVTLGQLAAGREALAKRGVALERTVWTAKAPLKAKRR